MDERIAGMSNRTAANRIVISRYAQRVLSANIFAGITTSCIHASLALLAIGINETFGSAAWRDAQITG